MQADLAERIDACLPQTQCGQCGFADCRRYAEALARGAASMNACPPGGQAVREALADLVGAPLEPPEPIHPPPRLEVARIDEPDCIGCTKCLSACPLDALVGAAGLMHGVVDAWCSGCGLCVPVCPTDCIELVPVERFEDRRVLAARWRARYETHRARHAREDVDESVLVDLGNPDRGRLEATIAASVARHRALD